MGAAVTVLSPGVVRRLAARAIRQAGPTGRAGAELQRELEALDRDGAFTAGGRAVFQDLLARLGIPTAHAIRLPLNDEPFWFRVGHPLANHQSQPELPETADVVVIGAGLTGASAAYHLGDAVDSGRRIVVLDQGDPAGEASGRNGGNFELIPENSVGIYEGLARERHAFLRRRYPKLPIEVVQAESERQASLVLGLALRNRELFKGIILHERIDCDFAPRGWLHLASTEEEEQGMCEEVTLAAQHGQRIELWSRRRIRQEFGIDNPYLGRFIPGDGTYHPFKYVCGRFPCMALLGMQDVSIAFGGPPVLDHARVAIERGERVCLLGRNGAGKSTIMRLLDGSMRPDEGEIVRQDGVTVARLEQEVPDDVDGTTYDVVAQGLGPAGALLARYHHASHRVATEHSDAALREMDRLHHELDVAGAWEMQTRVETVLQHLSLDPDAAFPLLSGGRKRQVMLARALVRQPDILLLDEPTNHLDVDAIEWMERFLVDRGTTLVFVTHDRAFLRRLATRIVELDRGRLVDWGGDYDTYLRRKEAALAAEAREWEEFDRKLAKEEVWIRTGIQARRTRNEGRVRSLEALRLERGARRERVGTVRLQAQEAERSGKLVVQAAGVGFSRGDRPIVKDLTTTIMRGDRVGLIGPNGSGKTTLLRLLLGELPPDSGTIRLGTGLEVAYFDQLREQLDPERSVFDSVADGADFVEVRGARKHVAGYLQDFLFSPDRARTPVRALSGGERNRLLLARLFTRTFNLLVLDEPTNDLDIETLDLLEELLLEFSGTLLLVSHDRDFLDAVVTSTLVFEGGGRVAEYAGGYTDWVRQRPAPVVAAPTATKKPTPSPAPKPARPKKLSYRETAELAELPDRIDALEREREQLYLSLSDPALLRDGAAVGAARGRLEVLESEITALTGRWETLETIAAGGDNLLGR